MNFAKSADGLVPAVIQHATTRQVLMLGYMDAAALAQTRATGLVTFYSRSRQQQWVKGETSGHFLHVREILGDCDDDALLILAAPAGPTCHTGATSCFGEHRGAPAADLDFLAELQEVVAERVRERPAGSYVAKLLDRGLDRAAQKVGEEAVETVIASKNPDLAAFESEAADLLFHLMVLLQARGSALHRVAGVLRERHQAAVGRQADEPAR